MVLFSSLFFLILLFFPRTDGQLIGGDDSYYYTYCRTMVIDGDLDISNDIVIYNARMPEEVRTRMSESYSFSIGPAILWTPYFFAGHYMARLLSWAGVDSINADGYSFPEQAVVTFGSMMYGIIGVMLTFLVASRFYSRGISYWATILAILTSAAFYYLFFQPCASHAVEIFAVGLLIYLVITVSKRNRYKWLIVGASLGLLTIVRWQDILFAVFPAIFLIRAAIEEDKPGKLKFFIVNAFLALLGFIVIFIPQLVFWKATLGKYILVPQNAVTGGTYFNLTRVHIFGVLFSLSRGWITWTPINLVGLIGIFLFKDKYFRIAVIIVFLFELYVCGTVRDWYCHWAFGQRRMLGLAPVVCLGVAAAMDWAAKKRMFRTILVSSIVLIYWNFAFIIQTVLYLIPRIDPVTFRQLTLDKLTLPVHLIKRLIQ